MNLKSTQLIIELDDHIYNTNGIYTLKYKNDSVLYRDLLESVSELKALNYIPNTKSNNGFVLINIKEDNSLLQYAMIYTTYDGVVFKKENNYSSPEYFKNDVLEKIIAFYLTSKN